MKAAHQMRITRPAGGGYWERGSGEPEHLALTWPVDRQVVDACKELPIEMRWLPAREDRPGDVGGEVGQAKQRTEVVAGEVHAGRRFVQTADGWSGESLGRLMCSYDKLYERGIVSRVRVIFRRSGDPLFSAAFDQFGYD